MQDLAVNTALEDGLEVNSQPTRPDTDSIGTLVADALSELARLALEGASREELAACATGWLERAQPDCRAVVVEPVEGTCDAAVLSDGAVSGRYLLARFSFGPGSVIARASREPLKVIHAMGPGLADSVTGLALERAKNLELACAGIMGKAGGGAVLVALMEAHTPESVGELDVALLSLASQLAIALSVSQCRAAAAGAIDSIKRAKMEWERTVDALADIVCLLDSEGRIVRANRVVEQWALGHVGELIGRPIHEAFHPGCARPRCVLARSIEKALHELARGKSSHFDYRGSGLELDLHFTFRPMLADSASSPSSSDVRGVLVVANVSELRRARDALAELNSSLERKVRARTEELREANRGLRNEVVRRKAAEEALRASHNERGVLSEQLIVAQENERHRIARELHDAVGQSLSAVKYSIEQAIEMLRRPGLGDPLPVLARAVRSALDTTECIRTIATSLRPTTLDDMGAASAVAGFCQQFAQVYRQIEFDIQITATDDDVPDRLATALFRSAQELLNNVVKHADATRVSVALRREPLLLVLEVKDDGVGIDPAMFSISGLSGHGIRNLRERAEMTGGCFELMPGSEGGTVARLSWPLDHDATSEKDWL